MPSQFAHHGLQRTPLFHNQIDLVNWFLYFKIYNLKLLPSEPLLKIMPCSKPKPLLGLWIMLLISRPFHTFCFRMFSQSFTLSLIVIALKNIWCCNDMTWMPRSNKTRRKPNLILKAVFIFPANYCNYCSVCLFNSKVGLRLWRWWTDVWLSLYLEEGIFRVNSLIKCWWYNTKWYSTKLITQN